jgi:hypothetical protein
MSSFAACLACVLVRLTRHWSRRGLSVLAIGVCVAARARADEVFEQPIRLQAADSYVDTGEAWGHSGPTIADVDGDGLRDLVVGDFSGKFRLYRNLGTEATPRYAAVEYLQAGGQAAQVQVY